MSDSDLGPNGLHHEIYLSDLTETDPAKMHTILRSPFGGAAGWAVTHFPLQRATTTNNTERHPHVSRRSHSYAASLCPEE